MACNNNCTKYVSKSGIPFYSATVSENTTTETLRICTSACKLRCFGVFGIFVPSQPTTTTLTVDLTDCNGNTAPLYLASTGVQATAAALVANTTHLVTFDKSSGLYFLQD